MLKTCQGVVNVPRQDIDECFGCISFQLKPTKLKGFENQSRELIAVHRVSHFRQTTICGSGWFVNGLVSLSSRSICQWLMAPTKRRFGFEMDVVVVVVLSFTRGMERESSRQSVGSINQSIYFSSNTLPSYFYSSKNDSALFPANLPVSRFWKVFSFIVYWI